MAIPHWLFELNQTTPCLMLPHLTLHLDIEKKEKVENCLPPHLRALVKVGAQEAEKVLIYVRLVTSSYEKNTAFFVVVNLKVTKSRYWRCGSVKTASTITTTTTTKSKEGLFR